jgi:hypothetical protein
VRFISVNDNIDSADGRGTNGDIILPLKNLINEVYSLEIGKKIKAQARRDMQDGKFIGMRPPYGYVKDPNDCHKLIIDAESAEIVRKIFEWTVEGLGLNTIAKRLNGAGILPPNQYAQSKGIINYRNLVSKGNWIPKTISQMLASEVYIGNMEQGKTATAQRVQTVVKDKSKWVKVENTHAPIISREIFFKVQEIRGKVIENHGKKLIKPYTPGIFGGKAFCACCGGHLHRNRSIYKSGDVYYFYCLTNSRIAKGSCDGVRMRENELKNSILAILLGQAKIIIGNNLVLQQNSCKIQEKKEKLQAEIKKYKRNIEKYKAFSKSLYENLSSEIIDNGEYARLKSGYTEKIQFAENSADICKKQLDELNKKLPEYAGLSALMAGLDENSELTAKLIDRLIERIDISKNNTVKITFSYKDEFQSILDSLDIADGRAVNE